MLDCCFYLLDKSLLSYKLRGNPVHICRQISALVRIENMCRACVKKICRSCVIKYTLSLVQPTMGFTYNIIVFTKMLSVYSLLLIILNPNQL